MTTSRRITRRSAVRTAAAATTLPLVNIGSAAVAGLAATMGPMRAASAADTTGVTDTEIKIGHTNPYSGPASSYSSSGKLEMAFFNQMVNDQGGIAGRKVNFISYDDQYSPPKTVEQVRRLVEEDKVAFLFNTLGTPTNSAIVRYVNQKKVPHLFVASGADKWGDYKEHPWTIGFQTSYRTEAQIYAKYILQEKPNAKIGILYQNDDYGKDYPAGMKVVLGDKWDQYVVKAVTYEVTDPTIDSQIASLQAAGCDVLVTVAIPKFAVQTIRKVYDLNWKPLHVLNSVAVSVGLVMEPVGAEKGIGIVSTGYLKDPTDPAFKGDPGMNEWRDFMAKYLPGGDINDITYVFAYSASKTLMQVLKQCGDDLSRENVMRQATNLHDLELPTLLPGIKINTGPTNYRPMRSLQLMRWDGKTWVRFGDVIEGAQT
jgi:branched-chain amino acid transport system substrate-binding protein